MGASAPAEGKGLRLARLGGISGVLGPVLSLVMILATTIIAPWFRWDTHALSDLGVADEALLFNSALLIGGGLSLIFAVGLWSYLPRAILNTIGATVLAIGWISLALVGVFTLNFSFLHGVFALGFFVLAPVALLLLGAGMKGVARGLTLGAGLIALLAILVLPIALVDFQVGFAVPEIVEALVLSGWVVVMSTRLLRH